MSLLDGDLITFHPLIAITAIICICFLALRPLAQRRIPLPFNIIYITYKILKTATTFLADVKLISHKQSNNTSNNYKIIFEYDLVPFTLHLASFSLILAFTFAIIAVASIRNTPNSSKISSFSF